MKITLEIDPETLSESSASKLQDVIAEVLTGNCILDTAEPMVDRLTRFYADLSERQRDLVDHLLEKCQAEGVLAQFDDLVKVTQSEDGSGLGGVHACVTRNFRTAMGDRRVSLITDAGDGEYGLNAKYADMLAEVSESYWKKVKTAPTVRIAGL